jgi:hypothetical protein
VATDVWDPITNVTKFSGTQLGELHALASPFEFQITKLNRSILFAIRMEGAGYAKREVDFQTMGRESDHLLLARNFINDMKRELGFGKQKTMVPPVKKEFTGTVQPKRVVPECPDHHNLLVPDTLDKDVARCPIAGCKKSIRRKKKETPPTTVVDYGGVLGVDPKPEKDSRGSFKGVTPNQYALDEFINLDELLSEKKRIADNLPKYVNHNPISVHYKNGRWYLSQKSFSDPTREVIIDITKAYKKYESLHGSAPEGDHSLHLEW